MADSYTLRAGDMDNTNAEWLHEAAHHTILASLGSEEMAEALEAIAKTLATSDGTVHIRCYYRDQQEQA